MKSVLHDVLALDIFILFHDFTDTPNRELGRVEYRVALFCHICRFYRFVFLSVSSIQQTVNKPPLSEHNTLSEHHPHHLLVFIMVLADLGKQLTGALAKLGGGGGYSSSSSSPLDEALVDAVLKDIAAALLTADVNVKLVMTLRQEIKRQAHALLHSSSNNEAVHGPQRKRQQLHKLIFTQLVALVDPTINATGAAAGSSSSGTSTSSTSPSSNYSWKPKKGRANTIMLVGLQGSGKTTTCTKLAHYYIRKGWKVCLVCTDTFRAGAFDQLKQNATKAGIPFYGSYSETDPVQLAIVSWWWLGEGKGGGG